MNPTEIGKKAELAASNYLEMRGYKVIERNWHRPRAEIDILAEKDGVIHFVEVKYRATNEQGGGLEAITPTKLKQMQRAAWLWVDENKWRGEYTLSAVELAGPDYTVIGFIEDVF
ncbi:MAG TPA: YraN family protein [Candidatus Saccharimonadia bacterium]|nr:YraN family protein [Candidatus Saccharimonadia bacterium]